MKCDPNANCNNDKVCVCRNNFLGDGFICRKKNACEIGCPAGSSCSDGQCVCQTGFTMLNNECTDIDECARGDHNCHKDADCTNNNGGFSCACKKDFTGDGVSCVYKAPPANIALPTASSTPTGVNIDIYTELSPGQCSIMGFEWENLGKLMKQMKWSNHVSENQYFVEQILAQFQFLGKKAIVRIS